MPFYTDKVYLLRHLQSVEVIPMQSQYKSHLKAECKGCTVVRLACLLGDELHLENRHKCCIK